MHANSYLTSWFKIRDIFPKLVMAVPALQQLALVRSQIPAQITSMRRQSDDLIALSFRNLPEGALEKRRMIVSPYREYDGSKNVYIEFPPSLPRLQVMKILKAANHIVISSDVAVRILEADNQLPNSVSQS